MIHECEMRIVEHMAWRRAITCHTISNLPAAADSASREASEGGRRKRMSSSGRKRSGCGIGCKNQVMGVGICAK
jgi:hypothetical protein